jgi:pimeloyl-ACP methyl ester carboxylesterase
MSDIQARLAPPGAKLPGGAFRSGQVQVRGFDIRYWEAGTGPDVVLLHGSGGFEPSFGKDLLAERFHVVEFEQPGFADAPEDTTTTGFADLAVTLAAAVAALGVDRYVVIGSSMGGCTALWLAAQYPDRVRGIVTEGSMAFLGDAFARPPEGFWQMMARFIEDPTVPSPVPAHPNKPWDGGDYFRAMQRRRMRVVLQDRYQIPAFDEDLADALRARPLPALVLYGEFEPFVIPGQLGVVEAGYTKVLGDVEFRVVPGAGHDPQGEQPEVFAAAVGGFVEGLA